MADEVRRGVLKFSVIARSEATKQFPPFRHCEERSDSEATKQSLFRLLRFPFGKPRNDEGGARGGRRQL
ncbi:MAG: hypothetical protein ACP5QS_07180 [bacterium]